MCEPEDRSVVNPIRPRLRLAMLLVLMGAACKAPPNATAPPVVAFDALVGTKDSIALRTDDTASLIRAGNALVNGDRLVVLDPGASNAKMFDRRGKLLAVLGEPGDAVGDFRMPYAIGGIGGGRFAVYDSRRQVISIRDSTGAVLSEPHIEPGFYNGMLTTPGDDRIVLTGRVYRGPVEVRETDVHEFSLRGDLLRSYGRSPTPASKWDAKFMAVFATGDSGRLITAAMNTNRVRLYDRHSSMAHAFAVGEGWYQALEYPSDKVLNRSVSSDETITRTEQWMHAQRMMNGILVLPRGLILARFQAFDASGTRVFYYAVADTAGHTLARSSPTRSYAFMTQGDTIFWLTQSSKPVTFGFGVLPQSIVGPVSLTDTR